MTMLPNLVVSRLLTPQAQLLFLVFLVALCLLGVTATPSTVDLRLRARHTRSAAPHPIPLSVRIAYHLVDTHRDDLVVSTATPHFSWILSPEGADDGRGLTQLAYQLTLIPVHAGVPRADFALDSGRVSSSQSAFVHHTGAPLASSTQYLVRLRYWSSTGAASSVYECTFRTGLFEDPRIVQAQASWIGHEQITMTELRKEFVLPSQALATAIVYVSGLGYSRLYVNGHEVDPTRRMDPGWTAYKRRALYTTYNVTKLLKPATNAVAVWLGNGWFSQEQYEGGPPRLWFLLNLTYADGSSELVTSDRSWQGRAGPVTHDSIYQGSMHDGRVVRAGWSEPGFNDPYSLWLNASVLPSPIDSDGVFSLQYHDPIRLPPANLHILTSGRTQPSDVLGGNLYTQQGGVIRPRRINATAGTIFDLGQNLAGWCAVNVTAFKGATVQLRYAETLQLQEPEDSYNDRELNTQNLRTAASTDTFVINSTTETLEPAFTYHGFRYLQVRGDRATTAEVECYFVHSEMSLVGNFSTGNLVMNQLHHNIVWGQLSNLMSVPSDCSQRDERRGWMGDAGLTVDEALYNFDAANFYLNYLDLVRDEQGKDGGVGDTVPQTRGVNPADPNWGTAYPTIVWQLYEHYGDVEVLHNHFAGIHAWVECVRAHWATTGLKMLYAQYGDWVPPAPYTRTDLHLTSAFPFLRDVKTVATIANLTGHVDVALNYTALYSTLAKEFHSAFYTSSEVGYADGSQTANALALSNPGVVPSALLQNVVDALVKDVTSKGHLTTGIVGVAQLFPVLSMYGHHDLALRLVQMTGYPSYGWMFNNALENATTLWELWNSPLMGPGMNSRNHIMFGSVGGWFYRYVAGIALNAFDPIILYPRMAADATLLPEVHAEVVTVRGPVVVDYERDLNLPEGLVRVSIVVPFNTEAVVKLEPLRKGQRCLGVEEDRVGLLWSEGRTTAAASSAFAGVKSITEDGESGIVSVAVFGGRYAFIARWE